MASQRSTPRQADERRSSGKDAEYLARVFSDIELLAAADIIKSALAEGRKHVDRAALGSVLAKLTAAHDRRKRAAR